MQRFLQYYTIILDLFLDFSFDTHQLVSYGWKYAIRVQVFFPKKFYKTREIRETLFCSILHSRQWTKFKNIINGFCFFFLDINMSYGLGSFRKFIRHRKCYNDDAMNETVPMYPLIFRYFYINLVATRHIQMCLHALYKYFDFFFLFLW